MKFRTKNDDKNNNNNNDNDDDDENVSCAHNVNVK